MNKSKILLILPFIPYPLYSGGHQAIYNGIKAIIDKMDVYITFDIEETPYFEENIHALQNSLNNQVKIVPYIVRPHIEKFSLIKRIHIILWTIKINILRILGLYKENKIEHHVWTGKYLPKDNDHIDFINDLIKNNNINIVQCEMLQTASYVLTLPRDIKKVFVHHEIGFIREELNVKYKCKRPELYQEALSINKKNEIDILNQFDTIITLSSVDTKKLEEAGVVVPIYSSFAIVNQSNYKSFICENHYLLSFIGPCNHNPNLIGLEWFLHNCWMKLKETDKNYKLQIIGKWTNSLIKKYTKEYPDIDFKGFVEDLSLSIQNSIMIVPITIGSGIRMKILEAAYNGVPVVSTSVGAEGLPLTNGVDCFIEDTPEQFINAILQLKDKTKREQFINNSRNKISNLYSLNSLKTNRLNILQKLI